jgi:hypothetical protein
MEFIGKFRVIKRSMGLKQGTLGFHEDDGLFRHFIIQLSSMRNIVSTNAEYFHIQLRF